MILLKKIRNYLKNKRRVFSVDENTRILVIAPHPDDEVIGMGGFLCKHADKCTVLLATNGCCGNPEWTKEKTVEVRKKEFEEAMKIIGVKEYICLGINDRELSSNLSLINEYIIDKYNYIFIPNRYDMHPDHKCIRQHINRIISKRRGTTIIEYEVWSPLRWPNLYFDIDDYIDIKERAIRIYKSQLTHCRYDWGALGLNQFRGMLNGCRYAEAYFINRTFGDKILDMLKSIKDGLEQ